jgi:hypothetical protein
VDLDELARAYWAAPPYDEHDHSDGFEKHPFDSLQDLQLDATDEELSRMLRSLALTAPSQKQLASVGSQWVTALEYKFDAEGDTGKSLRLLVAAGLEPDLLFRVLSGIDAGWLRSMGAEQTLAAVLSPEQLSSLI